MAIITTINATDNIGASRSTINDNFEALNTELSAIEPGAEVNNISDVNATDLTDGGDTTLHKHDGRYYTESEVDGFLAGKANTTHTHAITDVTGLQTALDSKANTGDLGDLAVLDIVDAENVTDDIALACTDQNSITDYTFTGSERRNGGYLVTTASNRTVNIDPDLFVTGTEFTFCKGTNNANTVTLDSGTGNNINGSQTLVISAYNETVTILKDGANTWKVKSDHTPLKTINGTSIKGTGDIVISGGGGSTTWGAITGTLADQTDLQSALNAKLASADLSNGSKDIYGDKFRFDWTTVLTAATDLDTVTIGGFYSVQNAVNKPTGSAAWVYLEVVVHNDPTLKYVLQKVYNLAANDPIYWVRIRNNSVWSTWRRSIIADTNNLIDLDGGMVRNGILRPTLYDDQNPKLLMPGGSDLLYYAVERGFIVTANRAPTSGTINNMFNLTNSQTKWASVSVGNPVVLEIDFGGYRPYIDELAIIHSWRDSEANNYIIETYNDNNNDTVYARETHATITGNTKYITRNGISRFRIQKIKITVTVAGNGGIAGDWSVGTIMATSANNGKTTGAIAELGENTFYGDQTLTTGKMTLKNTRIINHTGNPEGSIQGNPGSICMADTGVIYQKLTGTGNTGRAVIGGSSGTPIQNEVIKIRSFI